MAVLRPLVLFGTRPEAIKLAPVVQELHNRAGLFSPIIWVTAQHRELLDVTIKDLQLVPNVDMNLMTRSQNPVSFLAKALDELEVRATELDCDCVIVQGDTTTTLAGGIFAFHRRIPVVHVEAGLRTRDIFAPFPEEFNRRALSLITTLHCAPTALAASVLESERIPTGDIRVTGNTVIDSVRSILDRRDTRLPGFLDSDSSRGRRIAIITIHRRESFSTGVNDVVRAVSCLADRFPDVIFLWPVHPNPSIGEAVSGLRDKRPNLILSEPLPYSELIHVLTSSAVVLTDSGGIQEEASYLGIPLVIARNNTERTEILDANEVEIVGTSCDRIVAAVSRYLLHPKARKTPTFNASPFGDGCASQRIVDWILERFG